MNKRKAKESGTIGELREGIREAKRSIAASIIVSAAVAAIQTACITALWVCVGIGGVTAENGIYSAGVTMLAIASTAVLFYSGSIMRKSAKEYISTATDIIDTLEAHCPGIR